MFLFATSTPYYYYITFLWSQIIEGVKQLSAAQRLRITRLRASKVSYILRQLGWQDKVENRGGSKSGSCAC
jgi:hypothetical protein